MKLGIECLGFWIILTVKSLAVLHMQYACIHSLFWNQRCISWSQMVLKMGSPECQNSVYLLNRDIDPCLPAFVIFKLWSIRKGRWKCTDYVQKWFDIYKLVQRQEFVTFTGFDLIGCDCWFTTRFWIFTTEFFFIMSVCMTR